MARNNGPAIICLCVTAAAVAFIFGIPQIGVSVIACLRKEKLCGVFSNASKAICDYASVVPEPVDAQYNYRKRRYMCGTFSTIYSSTLMSTAHFESARNGRSLCGSDFIKGRELGESNMCAEGQQITMMAFETGETSSDLLECHKYCADPFADFGRKFVFSFETGSVGFYFAWWTLIACYIYRNEIKERVMLRLESLSCCLSSDAASLFTRLNSDDDSVSDYHTMNRENSEIEHTLETGSVGCDDDNDMDLCNYHSRLFQRNDRLRSLSNCTDDSNMPVADEPVPVVTVDTEIAAPENMVVGTGITPMIFPERVVNNEQFRSFSSGV
jgi:hypothetical protein